MRLICPQEFGWIVCFDLVLFLWAPVQNGVKLFVEESDEEPEPINRREVMEKIVSILRPEETVAKVSERRGLYSSSARTRSTSKLTVNRATIALPFSRSLIKCSYHCPSFLPDDVGTSQTWRYAASLVEVEQEECRQAIGMYPTGLSIFRRHSAVLSFFSDRTRPC